MARLTTLILAAVLAVACNSKSDGGGETEPAASEKAGDDPAGDEREATSDAPSAAGEGDSADEVAVADEEIPTAEDFEAEVAEEITEDSLEKELEALEQEIGD